MELHKYTFTKAQLSSLPEEEQLLFIKLGDIADNIKIIENNLYYAMLTKYTTDIENWARDKQALFFLRILSGVIFEGWRFLKDYCYEKNIFEKYSKELPNKSKDALKALENYFDNNKNTIKLLRNKYAFHNDTDTIKSFYKNIDEKQRFDFYIPQKGFNQFFHYSDIIILLSIMDQMGLKDTNKTLIIIHDEINQASVWFSTVCTGFIALISNKIGAKDIKSVHVKPICIDEAISPYFCIPVKSKNMKK